MPKSFNVMSYNLASGVGLDGNADFDRQAAVVKDSGANLAGLQEISNGRPDLPIKKPLDYMLNAARMKGCFAKTCNPNRDGFVYEYGIGVMTDMDYQFVESIPLPNLDNEEPRVCMFGKVTLEDGRSFYFANTHLANGSQEKCAALRVRQIQCIFKTIEEKHYYPVILTGDMNALPDSECALFIQDKFSKVGHDAPTFPADAPNIKIDYIAYYPKDAFQAESYQVVEDTVSSDHRPIMARLAF